MKALVVGLGAIGTVFSYFLSRTYEIDAIGREEGKKRLRIWGKISGDFEVRYTKEPRGAYDLLLLSVKSYDLEEALLEISKVEFSHLVYLQNGPYADRAILSKVEKEKLIRVVTSIGAIRRVGGSEVTGIGETVIGDFSGGFLARKFAEEISWAGIKVRVSKEIWKEVWKKTLANACINPITAILEVKNGEILKEPLRRLAEKIFEEGKEAAKLVGVKIEESFDKIVVPVVESTKENYSSMLQDIMRGKRTEIDAINGEIVKVLRDHGKPAPYNEALISLIKWKEKNNKRKLR